MSCGAPSLSGARIRGGELSEEAVGRLLRAAFCCLAQLDDRGNVVRDFATLDQMLMASGVYERQPERRSACKAALQSALGVFQRATLVNVGTNYDVNHEALIRGWKTYANWLKDARRRIERLVTVDHIIGDSGAPEQIGALARLWTKLTPLSSDVERCARANQIAGAETSADLQDVLGPNGAFSDHWARQTLERSDAASPNPQAGTRSLDQRLSAVRQTVRDAIRYPEVKNKQLNRRGLYAVLGVLLLAGLGLLGWQNRTQRLQNIVQEDLNEQFRFFRLQSEATVVPANGARSAANDRELFAALALALNRAKQQGKKPNVDEASAIFRTSLRQLELGARNVLAGVSVLRNLTELPSGIVRSKEISGTLHRRRRRPVQQVSDRQRAGQVGYRAQAPGGRCGEGHHDVPDMAHARRQHSPNRLVQLCRPTAAVWRSRVPVS